MIGTTKSPELLGKIQSKQAKGSIIMKVYELPDDIFTDKRGLGSEVFFYHYSSDKDRFKEKSILKRNVFSLVINGAKTMHFVEKTVQIHDNEIHLLSAGNCVASVNIANNKPFESILIFFDDKVLFDFYSKHPGLISNAQKKNQSYVKFKKDGFINHFIQSLLLAFKNGKMPSDAMKMIKLQELLLYLLENHAEQLLSFQKSQNTGDTEFRIRKVIETNVENNLSIEELAFLCNVSPSTFKRHFKKIYNTSPTEWHNKQRMVLASKMLAYEKPSGVWHKLGFETHTGFTKSFKKYFGVLPKDFANKLNLQE